MVADTLQRDPKELDNQPKGSSAFVNDSKLYHRIVTMYNGHVGVTKTWKKVRVKVW